MFVSRLTFLAKHHIPIHSESTTLLVSLTICFLVGRFWKVTIDFGSFYVVMDMDMDMEEDVEMYTPTAPAAPDQQAMPVAETPSPIHTIYIRNLNYKLQPNELRKSLYTEFIKFGKILDVIVGIKRFALRGQAWIVFDQVESAVRAIAEMNGKVVLNRPVVCILRCVWCQDRDIRKDWIGHYSEERRSLHLR